MSNGIRVSAAAGFGALCGTAIALQVSAPNAWLGFLAGGLIAGLFYAWRDIVRAIPAAYRAARGWKTPPHFWKCVLWTLLSGVVFGVYLPSILLPIAFFSPQFAEAELSGVLAVSLVGFPVLWLLSSVLSYVQLEQGTGYESFFGRTREKHIEGMKCIAIHCSPIALLFYYLPKVIACVAVALWALLVEKAVTVWKGAKWAGTGIVFVTVRAPSAIFRLFRFFGRFGWQVFIRVHSHGLNLALLHGTVGTIVGYKFGSPLVGLFAGFVFALLDYEILSRRVLKVVPLRAK